LNKASFDDKACGKSMEQDCVNLLEVVVAPPFVYLGLVQQSLSKSIKISAQNCSNFVNGAYTGEVR
jgi:triosephosphate isomerase